MEKVFLKSKDIYLSVFLYFFLSYFLFYSLSFSSLFFFWKFDYERYKKSFLISVGSSEEEEGQAAVYKSKKGKGLRDIRQSINFSNNNMHIKSNNRALHG